MAYLIIPVLCFVLLAGLTSILFLSVAGEKVWKGRIDDLDVVLSVLMTADWQRTHLILKVPRRVTSMKMTFSGSVVRLEMPLVTQRQKSRRDQYLAILRDLGLDPRTSSHDGDHDILEWEVDGPPAKASASIRDAFSRLFDVYPGIIFEFRVLAHLSDRNVIDQGLQARRSGEQVALPTAATQGFGADSYAEAHAGCMSALAGLFLLPLPFMIAYLQFGVIWASAVLVAIIVFREIYRRWRRSRRGFRLAEILKAGVVSLAGATMYFGDPVYLQLIPTTVLTAAAILELFSVSIDLPKLAVVEQHTQMYSGTERWLSALAIVATCAGAAAMNEFLRAHFTLDAWVWFFAFFRIELVLGLLVTSIPLMAYTIRKTHGTDGNPDHS